MKTEEIRIYNKFITAVNRNTPHEVAELLYQHPFLKGELESFIPETQETPFQFALANPERKELAKVLFGFGAKKPEDSKVTLTEDPANLKKSVIAHYNLDTIEQLYILTGAYATNCDRTINDKRKGPHLRFIFSLTDQRIEDTKVLLKLFGIEFYAALGTTNVRYITITPDQFQKVNKLFKNHYFLGEKSHNIKIDNLNDDERLSLFNIIFSEQFLSELENRNKERYRMDHIMQIFAAFTMKKAPCFKYLADKGHIFEHKVILDAQKEAADPDDDESDLLKTGSAYLPGFKPPVEEKGQKGKRT